MIFKGLLFVSIWSLCYGTEMAKIKTTFNNMVTSSTLSWKSGVEGEETFENGVTIGEDGPLWCRGRKHAMWVAGAVIDGKCHVPFLSSTYELDKYNILVSINGFARLESIPWDRLESLPHNAVTTPDRLLATGLHPNTSAILPGYVSYEERFAFLLDGDEARREKSAMILTEVEPVRYHLTNVVMDENRAQKGMEDTVVKEITLENPGDTEKEIEEIIDYTEVRLYYWGNVKGTVTARNATVTYPSHIDIDIDWNYENEFDQAKQQKLSYKLPPGTAVKAQMVARVQKYEAPYTGALKAIYKDGKTITRNITSLHMDFKTLELRAEYAQPYYMVNETYLEDIEPFTDILVHSTTTTTTTTTTTVEPPEEQPQPDSLASGTKEGSTNVPNANTSNSNALISCSIISVILPLLILCQNKLILH